MSPPIFAQSLSGTKAQQYLHRARMFRDAAIKLPDYSNGEQYWPKYALLTHAIELSLKSFAEYSVAAGKPPGKHVQNHDLAGLYKLALQYGLPDKPGIAENIDILNELHLTHYSRYPQQSATPIPGAQDIADSTVDYLISTFTASINPR
jgi:hypothetical protein